MQLRCVCKSWNSLISDPKFAKKHISWSRTQLNQHHLLLKRLEYEFESGIIKFYLQDVQLPSLFNSSTTSIRDKRVSYPLNNLDWDHKIIGSCDGILCFYIGRFDNSVMVWNPSIRKFKILPPLKYYPELNKTIYGFGYDCLTDTFKVVAVHSRHCYRWDSFKRDCDIKIKVHTLGKNSWKTVEGFPSSLLGGIAVTESGKFVSGAIHWLVWMHTDSSSSWVIFSLDLGKESFQEFLPPSYGEVCYLTMTLGVLRDCLCILSHTDTLLIHVWLMKDYGNKDSWTKLFAVPYKELFGFQEPAYAYPLYISVVDQLLFDLCVELAVYSSQNGTRRILKVKSVFWEHCECFDNHIYIESLISPLP